MRTKNLFIKYSDWKSCHVIFCEKFDSKKDIALGAFHRTHSKLGFTKEHIEKINVISTPDRGWWLDLIGLNSNHNQLTNNRFENSHSTIRCSSEHNAVVFNKNQFTSEVKFSIDQINPSDIIDWFQFKDVLSARAFHGL